MSEISVAMCTYNGAKFLKQQLDSILSQTMPVKEIVVCDDGSTDETLNILHSYQFRHPKIFKIYKNEKNLRSVKNFEKAMTLCTNEIILLSDQDDVWQNNKVEYLIAFLNKNPHISVVATNGFGIDAKGRILDKYAIWDAIEMLRMQKTNFNFHQIINRINIATGASMALKKRILSEALPFPEIKGLHHDEWIALYASSKNQFDFIDEKLFYYREHENQQVGGIFLKKTAKNLHFLQNGFNFEIKRKNFKTLKRQLKILSKAQEKAIRFLNGVQTPAHRKILEKDLLKIHEEFIETKQFMEKKYFVRSFILKCADKITGKRKLQQ